jgi:hypothetical protein
VAGCKRPDRPPPSLKYVISWIEPNFDRCFQLMECDDPRLLQQWILDCRGTGMTFEIVPVLPSKGNARVGRALPRPGLIDATR